MSSDVGLWSLVINKLDSRLAVVQFRNHSCDYRTNRTLLSPITIRNKMVYFRTFVRNFRKWRRTWHYRTARHSQKVGIHAAECRIPSQSRFALINRHFYANLTRATRWNSRNICFLCHVCRHNYVPGPGCVFGKLSETNDFGNFERKYLGKWGAFSIEISALFRICCPLYYGVKSCWHCISTLRSPAFDYALIIMYYNMGWFCTTMSTFF